MRYQKENRYGNFVTTSFCFQWPIWRRQEPGFLWKVWTESEKNHEAGGIYLFTDEKSALAYLEKHTARLKNLGVEEVVAKVFDVNEPLSQINQAKLA